MISMLARLFYLVLLSIMSIRTLPILPSILFDPYNYGKSDLLIHDFRWQFPSTQPAVRCLLQIESKSIYLTPSCQLLTRTSLKSQCTFNERLKFELVLPNNTTVYELHLQSNRTDCSSMDNQSCQFEKNPYRIKLKENESYKNFLRVQSFAGCSSSNFVLSSSNTKRNIEHFSLNSSTGHLSLLQTLDYESNPTWKLVIQGDDDEQIPFYTYVIIDVDDVNDCAPLLSWNFPLQIIEVLNDTDVFHMEIAIAESNVEQSNVIIANLIASDLDSSLQFDLYINHSNSVPFRIDGPYGDATFVLLTTQRLDREIHDQYVLDLVLADYGRPRLTSNYQLTISIGDVNDHRPRFEQDVYHVDIQENNPVNTTLIQVIANDADLDDNGRVTYAFEPADRNDLSIDQHTGVIRATIQFDYEQIQMFTFNVSAIDHPPHGASWKTTAMIKVNIIDQNDNIPQVSSRIKKNIRSIHESSMCIIDRVVSSLHSRSTSSSSMKTMLARVSSVKYMLSMPIVHR
jgi:hypothetical protein